MGRRLALATFCGLLFAAALSVAQTPDSAALQGSVTDPSGAVLANATIVIEDANHHVDRTLHTTPLGTFTAQELPVGTPLQVKASYTGFADATIDNLVLVGGATATLRLQLVVAGSHAVIHLTGTADEVRADEPQLGDRLTAEQMQNTPVLNRRITYLPLLNAANRPAINQGDVFMNQDLFTANGTGPRQTWFEVDGANGDDAWGRQTIFTNVPLDAVSEMTVLDNAFAANYGFGEGAVVNIVTRSGTSRYHGDVLGLWRPSGPEANSPASPRPTRPTATTSPVTRWRKATTLSGPLPHAQNTFFLASGEYSYQDRASPVTSPVGLENDIGHYRDWLVFCGWMILSTRTIGHSLEAVRTTISTPIQMAFVGGNTLPSVARVFHRNTYTVEAGETSVQTASMVNDVRLQFQLASPITQFSPVIIWTQYSVPISSAEQSLRNVAVRALDE